MHNERVKEIVDILASSPLRKNDVRSLLTLARILTDLVPAVQVRQYPHLEFFCDWTVHAVLDRSKAGALVLAALQEVVE
jgi:hypothetical protein